MRCVDGRPSEPTSLVDALRTGNRAALAQALTLLEGSKAGVGDLTAAFADHISGIPVIGITGPPGAGKSTLVNALIQVWRGRSSTVAVVAVDPSSPISGGAILGDRVRMSSAIDDDGVFVRSLASQGHLGGLSPAAVRFIDAFDVAGYDRVLLETVGTGQNEVDVAHVADVAVVIAAPGLGDGIQAMKSGLLEVADILVVNKSDRPDAAETAQQLAAVVSLRAGTRSSPQIHRTTALRGDGVAALAEAIDTEVTLRLQQRSADERRLARGRYIVERLAVEEIRHALSDIGSPNVQAMIDDMLAGRQSPLDAVRHLLAQLQRD